uniref:GATOR1 complex protein NPRL3 C-terminal HTH domain-containing protein n=1 Tax=Macaca fascicularis TaxID=9541 RepID=A0A2K5VZP9_MACFA
MRTWPCCRFSSLQLIWCTGARPSSSTRCVRTTSTCCLPMPAYVSSSDDMTLTSPSMDNSSAELLPSGDSPLNQRMTENLLASLSEHERAAILSVPAAQNPEDLRMFARLLHYFRGRHHLEEIMCENTRRPSCSCCLTSSMACWW